MAGFFGLFGRKAQYIDEIDNSVPQQEEQPEPFFLPPDEAVSLGNVEFMRKPKTIKRTFPKTLKGGGGELVQAVSSLDKTKLKNAEVPGEKPAPSSANSPVTPVKNERRQASQDLDMFRQMAKDLNK
ncbi:MAG: hypothetical protein ACKN9E_14915 [Microcystaceae cyanobacterium]|nr:hypothetical protein [Merismopediaceae bacterium]